MGQDVNGRAFATSASGLFASEDGGLSWAMVSTGFLPRVVESSADGILWAAGAAGVFRSSDLGATWVEERHGEAWDVSVDGTDVVAIIDKHVERRREGVWTDLEVPIGYPILPARPISVASRGGRTAVGVYEAESVYSRGRTIVRDGDADLWRMVDTQPPARLAVSPDGTIWAATGETRFFFQYTAGNVVRIPPGATTAIMVDSRSGYDVRAFPSGAVVYSAGGDLLQANPSAVIAQNVAVGQLGRFAATSAGFILGTTQTGGCDVDPPCSFTPASGVYALRGGRVAQAGIVPSPTFALAVSESGALLAGGSAGLVHRLDGDAWVPNGAPLSLVRGFVNSASDDDIFVYGAAELDPHGVAVSQTGPSVYSLADRGAVVPWLEGEVGAIARSGVNWIVSRPDGGLYAEYGLYWAENAESDFTRVLNVAGLRTLAVSDEREGLAGAWGPSGYTGNPPTVRAWQTNDSGRTWWPDGEGLEGREVYAFVRHDGRTFAGTDQGVFLRGDDAPWTPSGLQDVVVRALAVASDTLLAGTSNGLFRAEGTEWVRYGHGLDNRTVYAIQQLERAEGRVLAVGTDLGVWATQALATVGAEPGAPPADTRVVVGPNPTRGMVGIRLGATWPDAEVSVFDAVGRRVSGPQDLLPGSEARLDLSGQPPGIYLVRVSSHMRVVTRTISVMR